MRALLTSDTHDGYSEHTEHIHHKFLTKISREKPDIVLHAGDWGLTETYQVNHSMEMFRAYFPNTPIFTVMGNHDFWTYDPTKPINITLSALNKIAKKHNITILTYKPTILQDVVFMGYTGWYNTINPPSNDGAWIKGGTHTRNHPNIHSFLKGRSDRQFKKIYENIQQTCRKIVILSHFNADGKGTIQSMNGDNEHFKAFIEQEVDVICYGHTHIKQNYKKEHTRVLNAGSHYNMPDYIVFDI